MPFHRCPRLLSVLVLATVALGAAAPTPVEAPAWLGGLVGRYLGRVRNAGRMECGRTELRLQDGQLVGHYWIDADPPFEGELTQFVPESGSATPGAHAGTFTWTDRYGTGREYLAFTADGSGFRGFWGGEAPSVSNPVWAVRSQSPCEAQVSDAIPAAQRRHHV